MGLYKRSKIWWISITVNGKRQRFSTGTTDKKQAEIIYSQVVLQLNQRAQQTQTTPQVPQATENQIKESSMTFEGFFSNHYLPWCEGRQASYEVKKYYLQVVPPWFKSLRLNQIGLKEVEQLQSYFITKNLTPAACNKYINILKASMTKACDWGYISEQRLKNIRRVKSLRGETKRLRYLTEDEIKKLLSCCDRHIYPIVFVALHTGMRKGEILNLKWSQIDLKNDLILLEKTKNGERREIPMSQLLKSLFLRLKASRTLDTDYVFVNPETGKPYRRDLKRSFASACRRAGIHDFHFHDLRHTFASHLVMSGVDLTTVKELLGHKDIKMTLRYAHLAPAHKKQAVDLLGKKIQGSITIYHNPITIYHSGEKGSS